MLTYLITGANGHLGGAIVRALEGQPCHVRGLLLPGESARAQANADYIYGDVTKPETLTPLLFGLDPKQCILIHTAGLIDIGTKPFEELHRVNVEGTKNVISLCQNSGIRRMVYVSSVHAIPEGEDTEVLCEQGHFEADQVQGSYAKTKAEATQLVLTAAQGGLDAVVVHPSGIIGPYESAGNHLVQVIRDYLSGKLPACVKGGYDMVDVRDVAQGCLSAALHGRKGECYILSNRHYEIDEMLSMVRRQSGGRRLPVLPIWLARLAAPLLAAVAKLRGRRPLYTGYSLNALCGNDRFSHDKATMELRYRPRDLRQTVADTVLWLSENEPQAKKRRVKVRRLQKRQRYKAHLSKP